MQRNTHFILFIVSYRNIYVLFTEVCQLYMSNKQQRVPHNLILLPWISQFILKTSGLQVLSDVHNNYLSLLCFFFVFFSFLSFFFFVVVVLLLFFLNESQITICYIGLFSKYCFKQTSFIYI